MTAVLVDRDGFRLATTTSETWVEKALARREIVKTETPGLFRLAEHADRLLVTPGLTPAQARRRYLDKQKGGRR